MIFLLAFMLLAKEGQTQYSNRQLIKQLNNDKTYIEQKSKIVSQFQNTTPGRWGEFVKGVDEDIATSSKVIAFTFDACGGGRKGNRYNSPLIEYLRAEKVPATLFVTGLWIDANPKTFLQLAKDTLFEIENHGFRHRPCAVKGESEYGIKGTATPADAFDEMEANAIKIERLTGRKPKFYRSATAFTDEAGVRIASKLGITVISFDILSGDAVPKTSAQEIVKNVTENAKPGAIVIMHFNHPESNLVEAMRKIVPQLRSMGYRFVRLEGLPLKGKQPKKSADRY
ncbi:polysaccharide deacetylase family protein [uncultured Acetobacteroides sp.]|uniref:polysaccharide deacetylase family protein n=1 Tax=uncultured Acetobacteroides sp. TaxID=1760811 RepID=UPI0029F4992F|nr:polysaccharide deacetylase family protein [uncultured Acetobacteroides sp.]